MRISNACRCGRKVAIVVLLLSFFFMVAFVDVLKVYDVCKCAGCNKKPKDDYLKLKKKIGLVSLGIEGDKRQGIV